MGIINTIFKAIQVRDLIKSQKTFSEFKKQYPDLMRFYNILGFAFRYGMPGEYKPSPDFAGFVFYDTGTMSEVSLDPENNRIFASFKTIWNRFPIGNEPYEMINWVNKNLNIGKFVLVLEIMWCNKIQLQYGYETFLSYKGIDFKDDKSIQKPIENLKKSIAEYKEKFERILNDCNNNKVSLTFAGEIEGKNARKDIKELEKFENNLIKKAKRKNNQKKISEIIKTYLIDKKILESDATEESEIFKINIPCKDLIINSQVSVNIFDQIIIESSYKIEQSKNKIEELIQSKFLLFVNSHFSLGTYFVDFENYLVVLRSGLDVSEMKGNFNIALFESLLSNHIDSNFLFYAFDEYLNNKPIEDAFATALEKKEGVKHSEALTSIEVLMERINETYPTFIKE